MLLCPHHEDNSDSPVNILQFYYIPHGIGFYMVKYIN